jgi:heptosyltransferase-3
MANQAAAGDLALPMTHLLEHFCCTRRNVSLRSKRVLVVKTTQLGDLVISLPMAGALKRRDPQCVVILLTNRKTIDVARCCLDVDEVYSEPETAEELQALLMTLHIDIVIHAHSSRTMAEAARAAAIPVRIGTVRHCYNWRSCTHLVASIGSLFDLNKRLIDLQYLRPLGIAIDDLRDVLNLYHLAPPRFDERSALHPGNFAQQRRTIILSPALITARRHQWPLESYTCLIRRLDTTRFHWFICGAAEDRNALDALIARHAHDKNVTNMVGQLSLSEFMSFISCCDGLVAGSTGPLHLAAALGIRALGLFQSRKKDILRWHPVGPEATIIHSDVHCRGERKGDQSALCPCIVAIGADRVAQQVLGWFDSARVGREQPVQIDT